MLVRRFSSADKPEPTQAELEKQQIPLYWVRMPKILSATAGMHRWVWDLRYPPPESITHEYPISAVPHDTPRNPLGPSILPGEYKVRLAVNGKNYTAPLTVKMDPRVKASSAELEQQFVLQTRLASLLTQSSQATVQARSLREQVQKVSPQATGSLAEALRGFDQSVKDIIGKPAPAFGSAPPELSLTRLNADAGGLYGELDRGDAAPTLAQRGAADKIGHDLGNVLQHWEELKNRVLPTINQQLHEADLPEIRLDSHLRVGGDESDSD